MIADISAAILRCELVEKWMRHELDLSSARYPPESHHVYCEKSTSRKPAFDEEISKNPVLLKKWPKITGFCAFLPIFSFSLL